MSAVSPSLSAPQRTSNVTSLVAWLGGLVVDPVSEVGELTQFAARSLWASVSSKPRSGVLWPVLYQVGVRSLPVILTTGGFIGMVLAVQTIDQLKMMGLENQLGAVINASLVRELGPVLAAVMLAGRVGSAMAAELGTMKVTEQIDALDALGADPVKTLVVPRVWACVLLIPTLTLMADGIGIASGYVFSTQALGIDAFHYWHYSVNFVTVYDIVSGLAKSIFFGAAISVISCHEGMHSGAGAEGVGRAATDAFVRSFIAILLLDLLLGMIISPLYWMLWPTPISLS